MRTKTTSAPSRPCRAPGCARIATDGAHCHAHANARTARSTYDATTRRDDPALAEAARIRGSGAWQTFRTWYRIAHPICCDPLNTHPDEPRPTAQIHHVIGLADRPDLACDPANCQPLCTACHAALEQAHRAASAQSSKSCKNPENGIVKTEQTPGVMP